jgi:hypothetical protein
MFLNYKSHCKNSFYYYFYPHKPINKTVIRQTLLVLLFYNIRLKSILLEKKIIEVEDFN